MTLLAFVPGSLAEEKALHRSLRHARFQDELYPRSILDHPALPSGLRATIPSIPMWSA
jgi:hypothetical protein